MESEKEFERIIQVITGFYDHWSEQYSKPPDIWIPTIVMHYYHVEGHFRQHARPKLENHQKLKISETFGELCSQYKQHSNDWGRVCQLIHNLLNKDNNDPKLQYVRNSLKGGFQNESEYKATLSGILSENCSEESCDNLLKLLTSMPFWSFPLRKLSQVSKARIKSGSDDILFRVEESDKGNGKLKISQLDIQRGEIDLREFKEIEIFDEEQPDDYFLLYDLLERSVLIQDLGFKYAYILALNDGGFYRGNASLLKVEGQAKDDGALLRQFFFDIKMKLIPEIRMAMNYEVQLAISRDAQKLVTGTKSDRAKILEHCLLFFHPLKVEAQKDGYKISITEGPGAKSLNARVNYNSTNGST